MKPVNPLLPALRPDTPGLLRRAGGLLDAVRGIQQEANIDSWYDKAFAATQAKDWPCALHYARKVHDIDPFYKWCEVILNRANVFLGNFTVCKENLFESLLHFNFGSKPFQRLFIDDIREHKDAGANVVKGKVVVVGQVYQLLPNERNKTLLECLKIRTKLKKIYYCQRKFLEFWSDEELSLAHEGLGLAIGDVVTSLTISSIKSHSAHWRGQDPSFDGMYYKSVVEDSVSGRINNDRTVSSHSKE